MPVGAAAAFLWFGAGGGETNSIASTASATVDALPSQPLPSLSAGTDHTCALKRGAIWCWGANGAGQLGDDPELKKIFGAAADSGVPVEVSTLRSQVSAISAGDEHTCAVKDGAAWCWGSNSYGQIGDGSLLEKGVPVGVSSLESGVSAISTGEHHTCALKDGAVWCWGSDFYGQIGVIGRGGPAGGPFGNVGNDSAVPVAVNGIDGGVAEISAGKNHTCALKNRSVWCWGWNFYGQLGNGNSGPKADSSVPVAASTLGSGVSTISAGDDHTCAVKDGAAWCWARTPTANSGTGVGASGRTAVFSLL